MSSSISKRAEKISLATVEDRARFEAVVVQKKIRTLKHLVRQLHHQLASLDQVPTPTVEEGLDFYTEVRRFEIEMLRRALKAAAGHQKKAARLLNLHHTTLNAMMRRYNIHAEPSQASSETVEMKSRLSRRLDHRTEIRSLGIRPTKPRAAETHKRPLPTNVTFPR